MSNNMDNSLFERFQQEIWSKVPHREENDGKTEIVKIGCEMVTIDGFSGHSDRRQLLDFVDQLSPKPKNIICHHGDYHKCNELGHTLRERYKCRTYAPKNLETVRLL